MSEYYERVRIAASKAQRTMRDGSKYVLAGCDLRKRYFCWWDHEDWKVSVVPEDCTAAHVVMAHEEFTHAFMGIFSPLSATVPDLSDRIIEVERYLRNKAVREEMAADLHRAQRKTREFMHGQSKYT